MIYRSPDKKFTEISDNTSILMEGGDLVIKKFGKEITLTKAEISKLMPHLKSLIEKGTLATDDTSKSTKKENFSMGKPINFRLKNENKTIKINGQPVFMGGRDVNYTVYNNGIILMDSKIEDGDGGVDDYRCAYFPAEIDVESVMSFMEGAPQIYKEKSNSDSMGTWGSRLVADKKIADILREKFPKAGVLNIDEVEDKEEYFIELYASNVAKVQSIAKGIQL